MFNFTTQTVYNQISTSGANKNLYVATSPKKPAVRIGNTRFNAEDIEHIYITAPTQEALASVTFDMADVVMAQADTASESTARIVLYLSLSMNNQDSFYANDLVYKGKPIYIEFKVNKSDTAADIAPRVVAVAKKFLLLTAQEQILNITQSSGKVTITAVNGYQQITKAILQKFDPEAVKLDCCTDAGEYVDVTVGVPVIYAIQNGTVVTEDGGNKQYKLDESGTEVELANNEVAILPGLEAFGDYNWIMHNLRLPTAANTNFWAPTKNEIPVVNGTYTQFIISIAKNRDGIAGQAVGQRVTSVTNHVLYVLGDYTVNTTEAYKVWHALDDLKHAAISVQSNDNPYHTSKFNG